MWLMQFLRDLWVPTNIRAFGQLFNKCRALTLHGVLAGGGGFLFQTSDCEEQSFAANKLAWCRAHWAKHPCGRGKRAGVAIGAPGCGASPAAPQQRRQGGGQNFAGWAPAWEDSGQLHSALITVAPLATPATSVSIPHTHTQASSHMGDTVTWTSHCARVGRGG